MSNVGYVGLRDTVGVAHGWEMVGTKPRVSAQTYLQSIAEGEVSGHVPWTKIGFNPTIGTTEEDVWGYGGVISWPTAEAKWEMLSSDNTQDIGVVIKGDAVGNTVQSDSGGSTTTLVDADIDFTSATAVAAGDCVILDPHGSTPEWGYVTGVATHTLTLSNGFSSGGSGASRYYAVIDQSAHTHAQVARIEYLDSSYVQHSEIVVLNGTTVVDTVNTNYFRVNLFRIIAAGSSGKLLGNLTVRADGGGTVYSYIIAGFTRARNIGYTVPVGLTLYVVQWSATYATAGNANKEYARIYTRANIEPSTKFRTPGLFYPYTEVSTQNSTTVIQYDIPTRLPAKTDIKVSALATTDGAVSTVLRGWLEPE